MWTRSSRPLSSRLHCTARFARRGYNGQQSQQLPTYFQQPPEQPRPGRRILRSILLGATCFAAGAYTYSWLDDDLAVELPEGDDMVTIMKAAAQDASAKHSPPHDLQRAQDTLELGAGFALTSKTVGHFCQLPSNLPCEDFFTSGEYMYFGDSSKDWSFWSIFDGHAGPQTAQFLKQVLPAVVGDQLHKNQCMSRPYAPDDFRIVQVLKKAFVDTDHDILRRASDLAESGENDLAQSVALAAAALSGSCALLALFDPAKSILRVANTGDSRAVLGRWDIDAGKYVAHPMSVDQTGFNQNEVERIKQEHPNEEVVDAKQGRVHGIAVSRAFGDARWKWTNDLTQKMHEKFWGPAPRPNGMIKTPPYLTAEPEVTETKIQEGEHPDFLIMASDGLWDQFSSEDAVTCVQQWLDTFTRTQFLEKSRPPNISLSELFQRKDQAPSKPSYSTPNDINEDPETYYNAEDKSTKWKVSPQHFVVEDENCGIHLIRNALGGRRRNLFRGVMTVQPPLSRNVRDDITVHVIFFGVETPAELRPKL